MINASTSFKNACDDPQRVPEKKFSFDSTVFSDKVYDYGHYVQKMYEGDPLAGSDLTVVATNDNKEFAFLRTDKTNIGRIGTMDLGHNAEFVNRFTGYLDNVRFLVKDRSLVQLYFTNRAQQAIDRTVGSYTYPVDYSDEARNFADLAWQLLTVQCGLDTTASTGNLDIDYASWLNYWNICDLLQLKGQAYCTGETVAELLRRICELTDALIYPETDGKIYFNKFMPKENSSAYLFTDALSHIDESPELFFNRLRIINKAKVWYGYDPSTQLWTGSVTESNTTSQGDYGLLGKEYNSTSVWHEDGASADAFAIRLVARYTDPLETVIFTAKKGSQAILHQIGDEIKFTWGQQDATNKLMKVYGLDGDLFSSECIITAEDMSTLNKDWFILDSATNGILDVNKLY